MSTRDLQQPFADVRPTAAGFSIPELKWRELLFVGAVRADEGGYVRDPARPWPPFRQPGLFPLGVRFVARATDDGRVDVTLPVPLESRSAEPLAHLGGVARARRLEGADAALAAACADAGHRLDGIGATLRAGAGVAAFLGAGSPLTHAIGVGMDGAVDAPTLDVIEGFFRERGAPCEVDLCPLADPSLLALTGERSYRLAEVSNALVRTLDAKVVAAPLPDGGSLRWTAPPDAMRWADLVGRGFGEGADPGDEGRMVGRVLFAASATLEAAVGGQVAAGAAMSWHDGVAVFFADATLPPWRGRGLQAALIAQRLEAAKAEGCDLALAYTQPGSASERHYQRAGFQVAYTRAHLVR